MNVVKLQKAPFDTATEIARLEGLSHEDGALGLFIGKVRADGDVAALCLEHYPLMAQNMLEALCAKAQSRFSLSGCTVIHRYGTLYVGENIVFVGTSGGHRYQALQAVTFLIDQLKTNVPFWKKLIYTNGQEEWIAQKHHDKKKSDAWDQES